MQFTKAKHTDISQLCELLLQLFSLEQEFSPDIAKQQRALQMILSNPEHGEVLVIKQNGQLVAMLTVLYSISTALGEKVAVFEDMVVDQQHRQQGLGSLLLKQAIDYVEQQGCARISLLTDSDNEVAHRFYEKHGFSQSSMRLFRKLK